MLKERDYKAGSNNQNSNSNNQQYNENYEITIMEIHTKIIRIMAIITMEIYMENNKNYEYYNNDNSYVNKPKL